MRSGQRLEALDVTEGIDAPLSRQVGWIGGALTCCLAGMGLHQHPAVEDPHQLAIGADLDPGADQVAGDRIQGTGDLDVVVAGDLGSGIDRQVIGLGGSRQETRSVLESEMLRAQGGRAVHAQPGGGPAPLGGVALAVVAIDGVLPGEHRAPDMGHRALHLRVVLGVANRGGVDGEARDWAYSQKAWLIRGSVGSALSTMPAMWSGITVRNNPPKNAQAASKPSMIGSMVWEKVSHTKL